MEEKKVYELVVHKRADQDQTKVCLWQDQIKPGSGEELDQEIEQVLADLIANPLLNGVKYKDRRVAKTKRFKYAIHYTVTGHLIRVVGVFHQKQNPDKWTQKNKD